MISKLHQSDIFQFVKTITNKEPEIYFFDPNRMVDYKNEIATKSTNSINVLVVLSTKFVSLGGIEPNEFDLIIDFGKNNFKSVNHYGRYRTISYKNYIIFFIFTIF